MSLVYEYVHTRLSRDRDARLPLCSLMNRYLHRMQPTRPSLPLLETGSYVLAAVKLRFRFLVRSRKCARLTPNTPRPKCCPISRSKVDSLCSQTGPAAAERWGLCFGCELILPAEGACGLRSMARGLLHGIVAVTASAHSPLPPPLTVMPPPPLPPAPDDGGFSPLPAPSTELGRALPSSQHDGRQLAHSTTIVGSGSSQRRALQTAVSTSAGLTSALAIERRERSTAKWWRTSGGMRPQPMA
jgi:hypothetical protein